jgi:hypothetical protein
MDDLFPELIPDVPDGKVCVKCGVRQPEENFSIANGGSYRRTECNSCRKSAKELRDALRKIHKKPKDDYQCPICERPIKDIPFGTRSPLVLDHCHETETFRGWLCDYCNRGLGAFNDSLERLQNAIEYLRKHDGKEER